MNKKLSISPVHCLPSEVLVGPNRSGRIFDQGFPTSQKLCHTYHCHATFLSGRSLLALCSLSLYKTSPNNHLPWNPSSVSMLEQRRFTNISMVLNKLMMIFTTQLPDKMALASKHLWAETHVNLARLLSSPFVYNVESVNSYPFYRI